MNNIKYFLIISFLMGTLMGCEKETYDDVSFVETAIAPGNLSAMFSITQDNSGLVTITPNGEGAVTYDVFFGDATTAPSKVQGGSNVQHTYAEGVYDVKLVGRSINGKVTETVQKLTVSFKAPESLEASVDLDPANNFKVNVTAKALYETMFRVYYGDVANEVPATFLEGQTISHTYLQVGTYEVRIVALSGGAATTEIKKTIKIADPVLLPVTFESATLNYAFANFDGGNSTVVSNPQSNGINTSTKVAKMVKSAGQPWGGSVLPLGGNIDFSANKIFRMKVYSPRVGAKVLLKVENSTNSALNFEKEVATKVANAWEDMVFDYSAVNTSNTYQNIVLIFELGTPGDGSPNFTFLYDDIRLTNSIPSSALTLPVTFDDPNVTYAVIDFGKNATVDGVDPTNNANKVKITTKPAGAETWAGTTIGTFGTPIPVTATSSQMSIRVYSPAAGIPVRLKIEDSKDGTKSVETEAKSTVANAWETLVFDFANPAAGTPAWNATYTYDKASVFFDFGAAGSGKSFTWDDVKFIAGNANPNVLGLPLNFESATLDYTFTNFDGGNVTVIANPQSAGINTSAKVGKMVKGAGQPWGGSFIALAAPINFATSKTFKMKVYSPRVGAKVLLKVENLTDGATNFEKEVTTTKAGEWEELTFDYSAINATKSYQKIVLIFDLGTPGDGSANFTFLFDDIRLN
jgi:hypothetical protein